MLGGVLHGPLHTSDDARGGTGAAAREHLHGDDGSLLGDAVGGAGGRRGAVRAVAGARAAAGGDDAIFDPVAGAPRLGPGLAAVRPARKGTATKVAMRHTNAGVQDVHARLGGGGGANAVGAVRTRPRVDAIDAPRLGRVCRVKVDGSDACIEASGWGCKGLVV